MNRQQNERLARYFRGIADAFGPDEGVEFTKSAWASIRKVILEAADVLSPRDGDVRTE